MLLCPCNQCSRCCHHRKRHTHHFQDIQSRCRRTPKQHRRRRTYRSYQQQRFLHSHQRNRSRRCSCRSSPMHHCRAKCTSCRTPRHLNHNYKQWSPCIRCKLSCRLHRLRTRRRNSDRRRRRCSPERHRRHCRFHTSRCMRYHHTHQGNRIHNRGTCQYRRKCHMNLPLSIHRNRQRSRTPTRSSHYNQTRGLGTRSKTHEGLAGKRKGTPQHTNCRSSHHWSPQKRSIAVCSGIACCTLHSHQGDQNPSWYTRRCQKSPIQTHTLL
mmetsp:Transcript_53127/g.78763  ORF Transcript_53127/g.78763 Transcript_53127/m.78763 type:complete len:267 (-) Transcript_53127:3982-4782(-)